MNPGDILLKLAFATALASAVVYLRPLRGEPKRPALGTVLFGAHAALLTIALVLLGYLFLAHRFEYHYVVQYSSRALSPALTLAALWAGQEGSILLWTAIGGLLGLFVLAQPGRLSSPAMFFISVSQVFMATLLLVKSPFVTGGPVPADGMGLNPLLEDPWMVVHPPVLFVGYAAMLAPFALAAAALVRGEYKEWNKQVWPWTLFAVVSLGAGIVLGGVWAYKTLGWGGYWGWDPVENASLVPWLLAVALLHGLLIQRTLGAIVRTNLVLAVLGWLTTIGGTYLTRSGILSDFSVHSFPDTGLGGVLTAWLGASALAGAVLLAWRWRAIDAGAVNWLAVSRESALWLGLMTVLVLGLLVAIGTTMPLLTSLAGKPANVQMSYYHGIAVPLGLAILLLMALAPALRWTRQQGRSWLTLLPPGLVAGAVALALGIPAGLREPMWVVLLFATSMALGINAWMAVRLFRRGWMFGAGYLGHVGVAIMAVGIAVSTSMGRDQRVSLPHGQPVDALGYRLTYQGEHIDARGGQHLAVLVEKGSWRLDAKARLQESPRGDGMIRNPAIDLRREIYLSPIDVQQTEKLGSATWLEQGKALEVAGVTYRLDGFRMEQGETMKAYADITVDHGGHAHQVAPFVEVGPQGGRAIPAVLGDIGEITIVRFDGDHGRVAVNLPGGAVAAAAGTAIVEFSTKPMINWVWVGALLTLVGSALAGVRRAVEQQGPAPARRRPAPAATEPQTA